MNLANLQTLIDTVKAADARGEFDISKWTHNCGSPACIAGYAAELNGTRAQFEELLPKSAALATSLHGACLKFYPDQLAKYLEITPEEALEISTGFEHIDVFYPNEDEQPTPEQSIEFLETMLFARTPLTWRSVF